MLTWYAVYVNVKHEKKVVTKLTDMGITAYTPFIKKLQQWSDRKKWVEFPMLNGYVFVNIANDKKEDVLKCPGVFSFIKFEAKEAKIRDSEIEILKSIELSGYDVTQSVDDFKILDEIEVTQGFLKGIKGTVIQFQNTQYVQIQLQSLNQTIKVKLPKHIIKVITKP
ncbi:MAG: UpxY family transcription antiterminator [Bacteroidota bacterium]